MTTMPSTDPLDTLAALQRFGIRPGLETIGVLLDALDRPDGAFRSVIVAGTNGKGSVAAMTGSALRASGYRTGRYTSPHLISLAERIVVDETPIPESALRYEAGRLQTLVDTLLDRGALDAPPTFFEAVTAIALSWFRRAGVEVAVLEVGLGGRFDATNAVTPVAGIITSIGLDHMDYLGDDLVAIASEKAGVIKRGMAVVTTETRPALVDLFARTCEERGARLIPADEDSRVETCPTDRRAILVTTPLRAYPSIRLPLDGEHQRANALGAVRLLEALETVGIPVAGSAIAPGLARTRWPGRLQLIRAGSRQLLLDAAHNPAAAEALARYLRQTFPGGLPVVLGVMSDKDAEGIVRALAPVATRFVCTAPDTARAIPPATLAARVRPLAGDRPVLIAPTPWGAVEAAGPTTAPICVTGSIFLVGEILRDRAAGAAGDGAPGTR